jgi:hypothetical protein
MTTQGSELFSMTQGVHKTLLKYTLHSGYFHKCNFAGVSESTWKDDIKFMIPFLVLAWLRQLQQFFNKEQTRTWNDLGNYTPHLRLSHGEGSDPLAVVYLSKADTGQPVKVKNFNDIKPNESYSKKKEKTIVFTSLEEWAMLILKPPVRNQLDQAIEADPETQERWNRCKQKLKNGYKFTFNKKNYADKKEEAEHNEGITVQPRLDYSNKSINELHSVINKGLLYEQRRADKLEKKQGLVKTKKDD